MRRRGWIVSTIAGLLLIAGFTYFQHARTTGISTAEEAKAGTAKGYIDPAVCSGCHSNMAQTYRRTGMGRSFDRPTLSNTIGYVGNESRV